MANRPFQPATDGGDARRPDTPPLSLGHVPYFRSAPRNGSLVGVGGGVPSRRHPVSPPLLSLFPCYVEKSRENSRKWSLFAIATPHNLFISRAFFAEFPTAANREFYPPNSECFWKRTGILGREQGSTRKALELIVPGMGDADGRLLPDLV